MSRKARLQVRGDENPLVEVLSTKGAMRKVKLLEEYSNYNSGETMEVSQSDLIFIN